MTAHTGFGGQPRRRRGARATTAPGFTTLTLEEYYGIAQKGATHIEFAPNRSSLPRLDALGAIFELYRVRSLEVEIKATVGTTQAGLVIVGWAPDSKPSSTADFAMLSPKKAGPVWSNFTLSIPQRLVMRSAWYKTYRSRLDASIYRAGYISVSVSDGSTSVWVRYTVDFQGPTSVSRPAERLLTTDGSTWKDADGNKVDTLESSPTAESIEVELGGEPSRWDAATQRLQSLWKGVRDIHSLTQGAIRFMHWVSVATISASAMALPAIGVPAIIHAHPDPFQRSDRRVGCLPGGREAESPGCAAHCTTRGRIGSPADRSGVEPSTSGGNSLLDGYELETSLRELCLEDKGEVAE